ncbi:MAG: nickel pincer cofactor biosynthesis protein LarC [Candidatus Ranarchaeia archaeon]|jgi:uncharacterized protein (TIGR00299 family) protein
MNSLLIDCKGSGVAGNMFLGALIDLGADLKIITTAATWIKNNIPWCKNVTVKHKRVSRSGFQSYWVDFDLEEDTPHVQGSEFRKYLEGLLAHLTESQTAHRIGLKAMDILLTAESKVHDIPIEKVHLHETGSVDTLLDIACSVVMLNSLNMLKNPIYHTRVSVGDGLITTAHGQLSVPAPATLEILKTSMIPFTLGPIEKELATPTGVALLAALATNGLLKKSFVTERVGKGAGTLDFDHHPNILRLIAGSVEDSILEKDQVEVLETNVDDVSGEILGYTLQQAIEAGAFDASAIPLFSKKNRPAYLVQILCSSEKVEQLATLIIRELGTLGIRQRTSIRHKLNRESKSIKISIGNTNENIRVKFSRLKDGTLINIKPEFDGIQTLAKKYETPYREIFNLALEEARNTLKNNKLK